MKHPEIVVLIEILKGIYGESYIPYGTSEEEENGTGFRITGIQATFSAICETTNPFKKYDIQIESYPPGNYFYNETLDLKNLISLIEKYSEPLNTWPCN